jgi:hypothetical protein
MWSRCGVLATPGLSVFPDAYPGYISLLSATNRDYVARALIAAPAVLVEIV